MSDEKNTREATTAPVCSRPSLSEETREDGGAPPPEHRQWAEYIKQQHAHLQGYFATCRPSSSPSSCGAREQHDGMRRLSADLQLWGQAMDRAEEQPRLQRYAAAMHDLATTFWEQPQDGEGEEKHPADRRKRPRAEGPETHAPAGRTDKELNDRLAFSMDCLTSYYLGEVHPLTSASVAAAAAAEEEEDTELYVTLPVLFSRAVKEKRRAFFAAQQRTATPLEVEQLLRERGATAVSPTYQKALTYMELTRQRRAGLPPVLPLPPLRVLDVGSCYGPFRDRCCPHAVLGRVPLQVLGLDLQPYSAEGGPARAVWQADWLRLRFFDAPPAAAVAAAPVLSLAQLSAAPTTAEARVTALAAGAFDAVFFCLLLSYLPTARLRYLACLQAYLALRDGGLLVIVSTRTQGSRRQDWVGRWTRCLEGVGFTRVHLAMRRKIVGLSFARTHRGHEEELGTEAGRQRWLEAQMALPGADNGLVTLADREEL